MVIKEDNDIKRIYAGRYPNQKILPPAFKEYAEQTVIIYLETATVAPDKIGHEDQNIEVQADILRLETKEDIISPGKYTLVFPKKAFCYMMKRKNISVIGNQSIYKITFKKRSVKNYELVKVENIPDNIILPGSNIGYDSANDIM